MGSSIELKSVKNLTTEVDILNERQGREHEVTEFSEQSLVFLSPTVAKTGHLILINGRIRIGKKKFHFEATGRLTSLTPCENGLNRFEIGLHQYDKKTWADFLKGKQKMQMRADVIFTSIRGEDDL